MKIEATQVFVNDSIKRLGIRVEHAADAVRFADRKEVLTVDGESVHYFLRAAPVSKNGSHLLVYGKLANETLHMNRALRVYPDIHPRFSELRPSEVLEAVCQRFGRLLTVGDEKTRFILSKTMKFQIPPGNRPDDPLGSIIECHDGAMRDVSIEMLVRRKKEGDSFIVSVALAYCLDVGAYEAWARSHSKV